MIQATASNSKADCHSKAVKKVVAVGEGLASDAPGVDGQLSSCMVSSALAAIDPHGPQVTIHVAGALLRIFIEYCGQFSDGKVCACFDGVFLAVFMQSLRLLKHVAQLSTL